MPNHQIAERLPSVRVEDNMQMTPPEPPYQSKRFALILPVCFLFICFLWTSFYGLNFGVQWDETRAKFDSVSDSLKTGFFFQGAVPTPEGKAYNHGGVNYLLTWCGLTPEIMSFMAHRDCTLANLSSTINPILYTTSIRIRVRAIYVVLTSLTILWLFCLNLMLGRSRLEAFIAAAILTFSWEIAYHSRYVAPDAIMMQFAWLSIACMAVSQFKKNRLVWLYLGSVAIGLSTGTKYPGAIILPFFLVGAGYLLRQEHRSAAFIAKQCLGLVATAGLTFILTNPGVLLDPFRFANQLEEQKTIYASGWYGYSVKAGLPHLAKMLKYFSLQVFSHYQFLSIIFAGFSLLGIIFLLFERKVLPILIACLSLAYLLYFSQQSAMIVRNLLIVVPFLAMAAARGISVVAEHLGRRLKFVFYAGLCIALAANLGWEVYAARQIKIRHHLEYFLKGFAEYVQDSPNDTFFVSTRLFSALRNENIALPANLVTDPSVPHNNVAFFQTEGPDVIWDRWPTNDWGLYKKVFGPLDVNLHAYTTFVGNERIIVITKKNLGRVPVTEAALSARQQ
jgi:hypothetical protein